MSSRTTIHQRQGHGHHPHLEDNVERQDSCTVIGKTIPVQATVTKMQSKTGGTAHLKKSMTNTSSKNQPQLGSESFSSSDDDCVGPSTSKTYEGQVLNYTSDSCSDSTDDEEYVRRNLLNTASDGHSRSILRNGNVSTAKQPSSESDNDTRSKRTMRKRRTSSQRLQKSVIASNSVLPGQNFTSSTSSSFNFNYNSLPKELSPNVTGNMMAETLLAEIDTKLQNYTANCMPSSDLPPGKRLVAASAVHQAKAVNSPKNHPVRRSKRSRSDQVCQNLNSKTVTTRIGKHESPDAKNPLKDKPVYKKISTLESAGDTIVAAIQQTAQIAVEYTSTITNVTQKPKNLRTSRTVELEACDLTYDAPATIVAEETDPVLISDNEMELYIRKQRALKFPCSFCTSRFTTKTVLYYHINRLHTKEKPLRCAVDGCKKSFVRRCDLLRHQRSLHPTNTKSPKGFICYICDKVMKSQRNLRLHLDTHAQVKYECDICGKLYSQKCYLKLHKTMHEDRKMIKCPECTDSFLKQDALQRHLKRFHNFGKNTPSERSPLNDSSKNGKYLSRQRRKIASQDLKLLQVDITNSKTNDNPKT